MGRTKQLILAAALVAVAGTAWTGVAPTPTA